MPEANSTESNTSQSNGATGQQRDPEANQQNNPPNHPESSNETAQSPNPAAPPQRTAPAGNPQSPSFGEVLTAIQAMPEQLVRALREAAPAAQPPQKSSADSSARDTGTSSQNGAQQRSGASQHVDSSTPGKKTFRDWWFG